MKTDKNILIIGASQGIGSALAMEYALHGSRLVLASRNLTALTDLQRRIHAGTREAHVLQCDVSIPGQVRTCVGNAFEKLGRIDVAIYNAGVGAPEWMHEFTAESCSSVFAVNTFGLAEALETLLPAMRIQGKGVIAGVTSLADVRGYPGSASYCASKAAASVLLESARVEMHESGIQVITVRPGFVKTAMTAKNEFRMPFLMDAEKAARRIRKGIQRRKSVVQFPWPIALATRVIRILPNALFLAASRHARKPPTDN